MIGNWGRWGAEDQRGALNLLTPERVARALARPRAGRVFPLGTDVGKRGINTPSRNPTWHVTIHTTLPHDPGRGRAEDMLHTHTHAGTHIDGLAHVWHGNALYNGVDPARALGRGGTRHGSVEHYGGIVGTALILDLTIDGPLSAGDEIGPDLLGAAARRADVSPGDADILLIRTGWLDVFATDPARFHAGEPGLSVAGAAWVAAQDPACVGIDNVGFEPIPTPSGVEPLACHELLLRDGGIPLIENVELAAVAAAGITDGLFMAAPLKIVGGLGSPVNPLLIV
jgi:kynurenine formamidase